MGRLGRGYADFAKSCLLVRERTAGSSPVRERRSRSRNEVGEVTDASNLTPLGWGRAHREMASTRHRSSTGSRRAAPVGSAVSFSASGERVGREVNAAHERNRATRAAPAHAHAPREWHWRLVRPCGPRPGVSGGCRHRCAYGRLTAAQRKRPRVRHEWARTYGGVWLSRAAQTTRTASEHCTVISKRRTQADGSARVHPLPLPAFQRHRRNTARG